MLKVGDVLQRGYIIDQVLGKGGMGTVFLARQPLLNERRVAIKETLLQPLDGAERAQAIAQFRREAAMLAAVEHPNVVEVKDFFEEGDCQYLVMSYVVGQTLEAAVLKMDAAPSPALVLEWIDQICDALQCLHGARPPVLMRDLKPNNVMLDNSGRIRLIDFGLARVFEVSKGTDSYIKGAGTPGFCPLEQVTANSTDPRSDIYSLGATLYYLLTRTVPPDAYALSLERELPSVCELNKQAGRGLDLIIRRMMATRKQDRYQSIEEVRTALKGWRGPNMDTRIHAAPSPTVQPQSAPAATRTPDGVNGGAPAKLNEAVTSEAEPFPLSARPTAAPAPDFRPDHDTLPPVSPNDPSWFAHPLFLGGTLIVCLCLIANMWLRGSAEDIVTVELTPTPTAAPSDIPASASPPGPAGSPRPTRANGKTGKLWGTVVDVTDATIIVRRTKTGANWTFLKNNETRYFNGLPMHGQRVVVFFEWRNEQPFATGVTVR